MPHPTLINNQTHLSNSSSSSSGIEKISHCIAVASGKGGAGKTTIAVNLTLALCAQGFRVGLLDADIYDPGIPTMLDMHEQPEMSKTGLRPLDKFGISHVHRFFFIDEDQPVIWRRLLVSRGINDFLHNVNWGELDYLVFDLPPGTGDPSITIAKLIPNAAVIIVTTPQKVAIADVKKSINMFRKMSASILGIVENMAYFSCQHSDKKIELFGKGGEITLIEITDSPLLAARPIDMLISKGGDEGLPLMFTHPVIPTPKLEKFLAT